MDQDLILKSQYLIDKEQREEKVFNRFTELLAVEDAQVQKVNEIVMMEFSIHSSSTVWAIRKRVMERNRKKK